MRLSATRPAERCLQCTALVDPATGWTVYDATLGRSFRPYCRRCGEQTVLIERPLRRAR